jgi:Tfp pilus assembly protein PilV
MRRTVTKNGFTPLEKAVDFRMDDKSVVKDGDARPLFSFDEEQDSLTGFTLLEKTLDLRTGYKSTVEDKDLMQPSSFVRGQGSLTGFTLVEVIVAATLLTIAIVPILKALTQANMNTATIERRTQSLCLAQGKLNQVKAESIYNFDDNFNENNTNLGNSYLCNVSQTTVNSNLKAISVSVGRDQNGDSSLAGGETEITLQSQIAKRWD